MPYLAHQHLPNLLSLKMCPMKAVAAIKLSIKKQHLQLKGKTTKLSLMIADQQPRRRHQLLLLLLPRLPLLPLPRRNPLRKVFLLALAVLRRHWLPLAVLQGPSDAPLLRVPLLPLLCPRLRKRKKATPLRHRKRLLMSLRRMKMSSSLCPTSDRKRFLTASATQ